MYKADMNAKLNGQPQGIFYGWIVVTVCILCKIFKIQGH